MQTAFRPCTDNEGNGAFARIGDFDIHIGSSDLPDIAFCPWCGKETKLLNTAT